MNTASISGCFWISKARRQTLNCLALLFGGTHKSKWILIKGWDVEASELNRIKPLVRQDMVH